MIFIRYENWRSYLRYYPVTSILLAANVLMFIVLTLDGGSTNLNTLVHYGATVNAGPEKSELWRYVAAIFLHNGFAHLFFNCFALLVFAPPLERVMGWWRYALLYVVGGIIGNILSVAVSSRDVVDVATVSVGASGAIYAVYGGFLYIALMQRNMMDPQSRKTLYSLLVMGIIMSFASPSVDYMAHIGGLIAGFFLYGLILRLFQFRRRQGRV